MGEDAPVRTQPDTPDVINLVDPVTTPDTSPGTELFDRWFQALYETKLMFSGILDAAGRVLDGNQLAIEGCGLVRAEVIGRPFWTCGWWHRDPEVSEQVRAWSEQVVLTGQPFNTTSRYFLGDGTPRMVDLTLHPVRDDAGRVFIVATGSDVTDAVAAQAAHEADLALESRALRRINADQAAELTVVHVAEQRAEDRLQRLAGVALELVAAETIEDLTETVVSRGLPVLGADGGAVIVLEANDVRSAISPRLGEHVQVTYGRLPLDSPLPGVQVARTGERLVFPTRAAGLAFTGEMARLYDDSQRHAWVFVPLRLGQRVLGSLAVSWVEEREIADDEMSLIEAFAAQCAQVLERIQANQAQRDATLKIQRLAETLQRSLLASPPITEALDIAVRYVPADRAAQIGGDWHDAFTGASGATLISVGDVTGHDGDAAATMAQLRNLLRGLAIDSEDSPAVLLGRLDGAIASLGLAALATAVLARVEAGLPGRSRGGCRVRWSNAGHLPPLLRSPDGAVRVLASGADLLLGLDPDADRIDNVTELPARATLLLYTDGLIERRGESLDEGLARLSKALQDNGSVPLDELCARLLDIMVPEVANDDIAMLLVRPRPAP